MSRYKKALSIKQPWATMIVKGIKPVENRTWRTRYRGEVCIHAGKTFDHEGLAWLIENGHVDSTATEADFQKGGIVGRAVITDCVEEHDSPFFFGPYGFVLEDAQELQFQEIKGRLGFFTFLLRSKPLEG